jgi:GNAT superfamily N-acetyltransferase
MTGPISTRRAGLADLDAVMANIAVGLSSYVAFLPAGWKPPDVAGDRDQRAELLADPASWAMLALVRDAPVGHVMFTPARRRSPGEPGSDWRARSLIPGVAHLSQLFVLPDWWGRGVAPVLHDAATGEMRARGFLSARLFTPTLHARARRFYERRGWAATGEGFNDDLDLDLTEYRLALGTAPGDHPRSGSQPAR